MSEKVFTFWEPKEAMPGYVQLCMETWRRCLPGFEVVTLDFKSLGDYLSAAEMEEISCPHESLAKQADCIRCALLRKHGGTWLDADTVLTKSLDERFRSADVTMVARHSESGQMIYGGYIHAARPETKMISEWHRQLLPRIEKSRQMNASRLRRWLDRRAWKAVRRWGYFENDVLDPLTAQLVPPDFSWIDKDEVRAFPEESLLADGSAQSPFDAYVRYWFSPGEADAALKDCAGLIMLHNSWTPETFRKMSTGEFLGTDTRLASLLRTLTGEKKWD